MHCCGQWALLDICDYWRLCTAVANEPCLISAGAWLYCNGYFVFGDSFCFPTLPSLFSYTHVTPLLLHPRHPSLSFSLNPHSLCVCVQRVLLHLSRWCWRRTRRSIFEKEAQSLLRDVWNPSLRQTWGKGRFLRKASIFVLCFHHLKKVFDIDCFRPNSFHKRQKHQFDSQLQLIVKVKLSVILIYLSI